MASAYELLDSKDITKPIGYTARVYWKKQRLIEDFRPLLADDSYCRTQLISAYHNYHRESDGSIEFYVTRNNEGIPVVGGIDWTGATIDVEGDWGVHDELFTADMLTFNEFVTVVIKITEAALDGSDPAVDRDGDYMRVWQPGFGATPADALAHEQETAAEELARQKGVNPSQ